ncbi:HRDC domain-containing protein [Fontibacillus phaseoli]|uniref:HRDC domain-containing protein n=1 Tax=Fontibacillus phaseoli TaxID=1416533 RepID=A0A369B7C3_9BACL|nr:HRDC domain-containing protein [Fontibacillus phaseoli]RCX17420.1 HRDC domain-containing protein [Fontibacillus phaseoli]
MRIVFLNSLEKQEDGAVSDGAQVWIGEDEGIWRMGWNEITGSEEQETVWYEGGSWSEMLHVYRHRLVVKMGEGYRPVIEGIWDEREEFHGRGMAAQKLICYSEQHGNEGLYNELCVWRRKKAAADRKAPYMIASNRLLKLISVFRPRTVEELLQLPGLGESKATEYGPDLLEMVQAQGEERPGDFPLDWVEREIDEDVFRTWMYKQKEAKFRLEMEKFSLRRMVLESLAQGLDLEGICNRTGLERREAVELLELLEKDGYTTDAVVQLEIQNMPKEQQSAVWKAFEELGDHFLKPVLQRVYDQEAIEGGGVEQLYEKLRLIRISYRRQKENAPKAG